MKPGEAASLNVVLLPTSDFELKPFDSETGMEFLTSNWKYTAPGTKEYEYMTRYIKDFVSAGVFLKGENVPICASSKFWITWKSINTSRASKKRLW